MAEVICKVEKVRVEGPTGKMIPGVRATCSECDATQEAAGTSAKSVRLCLLRLRENCEESEGNFYVAENGEDQDD